MEEMDGWILNGKEKGLLTKKAERMSVAEMVIKMQDLVPNPVVALQELKDSKSVGHSDRTDRAMLKYGI